MKRIRKAFAAAVCAAAAAIVCTLSASAEGGSRTVNISVDLDKDRKAISPYIYGINYWAMDNEVKATVIRADDNRFTGYNWETGFSNAGADMNHISDQMFTRMCPEDLADKPGNIMLYTARRCQEKGGAYPLAGLQLAGYVAADADGEVTKEEKSPSSRWNKVEFSKGSELSLTPDLNDGVVYMDEFVNYLVNTLGDSTTDTGFKGYSMDNEPSLWNSTHPRIHPQKTTCAEIFEKNIACAKTVKSIDPNADVLGGVLFGYSAYEHFLNPSDWADLKLEGGYTWFIDAYLDAMKKAEDEAGQRLVDVLDIHYYSEAKGECGERLNSTCTHYDSEGDVVARMNAPRSLWDETYEEDSWIADNGSKFFPLLPTIQASIDKYYPGTKLSITEYDFGAAYDISGAIAEADALGIFAKNGVYLACHFGMDPMSQMKAIDLYTNYDGLGSHFGDTLVYCEPDDIDTTTAYASVDGDNSDVLKMVITNKTFTDKTTANISIDNGGEYKYVQLYQMAGFPSIKDLTDTQTSVKIEGSNVTFEMEPESVSMLVLSKEKIEPPAPAQPESSAAPAAESSITDSSTAEKRGMSGTLIAAIAAGAAAVIASAVLVIARKR
ncbi:MAG: glycoside hydrolase family 44 protein [Ruminococcus sp.]|nr:glycoside hydrolase family 44 protein [Ruminococcus sp.]